MNRADKRPETCFFFFGREKHKNVAGPPEIKHDEKKYIDFE